MNSAYDNLLNSLKKLPGLGYRSAERVAVFLLTENKSLSFQLIKSLQEANEQIHPCEICGNLSTESICSICRDVNRNQESICIVENVLDLMAIENSSTWNGTYHVLLGKISPINGVKPENLNLQSLLKRVKQNEIKEIVFALSNDLEGSATCHYIQDLLGFSSELKFTQVGFGIPSGASVTFADSNTLKSAFESRRIYN